MKYIPNMKKMVTTLEIINNDIGHLNASFELIERKNYLNKWNHVSIEETHDTTILHASI